MSSRWHPVSLFDADPDLVAGVPEEDRAIARRTLIVPAVALDTGLWSPPDDLPFALLIGLILLAGVLSREIGFAGRRTAELLGSGDILRPWDEDGPHGLAPATWRVPAPVRIPVVDARLPRARGARPRARADRGARRPLRPRLRALARRRRGGGRTPRAPRPAARAPARGRPASGDHRPPAAHVLRARDAMGQGHPRRHPPAGPADALDARRPRRRPAAVGDDRARDPRRPRPDRANPRRLAAARRHRAPRVAGRGPGAAQRDRLSRALLGLTRPALAQEALELARQDVAGGQVLGTHLLLLLGRRALEALDERLHVGVALDG